MKSLDSANSYYLVFNNVDAYIEENNEKKKLYFCFYRLEQRRIRKLHRTLG